MKKGKFGIVLCFYPIAAFAAVILNSPIICLALAAAAIFLEKDEWAGRQSLQAWMASVVVFFFNGLFKNVMGLIHVPFLSTMLSVAAGVLGALVYLGAIILSVLAILRVAKEEEANVPLLSSLAYRIYGKVRPKPAPSQYAAPYQPPQQPTGGYGYPSPGNGAPAAPQPPYAAPYPPQAPANPAPAPQYAPPANPAPQTPQQPAAPAQSDGQNGAV